jgi:hypothetical protein
LLFAASACVWWGALASVTHAQQAIVSLPSADVTPAGHGFAMHESQVSPFGQSVGWAATHFLTLGVGHHTELALTMFSDFAPDPGARNTLAFGTKTALPLFEDVLGASDMELNLVLGAMGLWDLPRQTLGHWFYGLVALRLPLIQTRIAVGASHGSEALFGAQTLCVLVSIEQPLLWIEGLTLVAEWFSGSHDLANLIVGFAYHPTHELIFVAGWKMPTDDAVIRAEEQGFVAEVGVFWH